MPLFKKKAEMPTPEEIEAGKVKSYKDLRQYRTEK